MKLRAQWESFAEDRAIRKARLNDAGTATEGHGGYPVPASLFNPGLHSFVSRPAAVDRTYYRLPWPPTGNNAVRHAGGAHYLRPEVLTYRDRVAVILRGASPIAGRYRLNVAMSPPDKRTRDIDNALKSVFDACVKAGWLHSDSMTYMRELSVTVNDQRLGSIDVWADEIDPKTVA